MKLLNSKHFKYYFIYTICFCLISAIILLFFEASGKSFVRTMDGMAQHFPALCYVRDYFYAGFSNGVRSLPVMDFSVGQGFDVIGTLNYYGLGDPLNLLTLLFPTGAEELMYAFMIFFRLYLVGIGFSIYCFQTTTVKHSYILIGSLLFVFSNYSLFAGFLHPFFINGPFYLVLLLVGLERFIQRKKPLVFVFTVAFGFMSNYYFMYINTLLLALYFVLRYVGSYRRLGAMQILKTGAKTFLFYLWGVCISAVFLFPACYSFLQNSRLDTSTGTTSFLYSFDYYLKLIPRLSEPSIGGDHWSLPGTGIIILLSLAILFVQHRKENIRLFLGLSILTIIICFPALGSLMNGFSYATNRWTYAFAFIFSLISVKTLPQLESLTSKQRLAITSIIGGFCLFLGVGAVFYRRNANNILPLTLLITAMLLIMFLVYAYKAHTISAKMTVRLLVLFTMLSIIWNINSLYSEKGLHSITAFKNRGEALTTLSEPSLKGFSITKDESFYRTERHWNPNNTALYTGDYNTNFYYSIIPSHMVDLYDSLWLNAHDTKSAVNSLDSRTALTNLAAVKYYIHSKENGVPHDYTKVAEMNTSSNDTYHLYENNSPLPLGYTYQAYLLRENYNQLSPLQREQALLTAAVIDEVPQKANLTATTIAPVNVDNSPFTITANDNATLTKNSLEGKKAETVKLFFPAVPDSETYIVLKNLKVVKGLANSNTIRLTSAVADTSFRLYDEEHDFYLPREGVVANLGYSSEGIDSCTLTLTADSKYTFDELAIFTVPMDSTRTALQERTKNSMYNINFDNHQITGSVDADNDCVMQFAIPYSNGWEVLVDGQSVETFKSSIAYLGVVLSPGPHTIVLTYTSPWLILGAIVTLGGLVSIVFYWLFSSLYKTKKKTKKNPD